MYAVGPGLEAFGAPGPSEAGLTFEQRKELLLLQTEREKLAVEKLGRKPEIKRLEAEERRLSLRDPDTGAAMLSWLLRLGLLLVLLMLPVICAWFLSFVNKTQILFSHFLSG